MFLTKLSLKEKISFFVAVIMIFLVLLDRLVIIPITSRIKQINEEIKISEKQLVAVLRNLGQKEFIAREYQKYLPYQKSVGSDEERTTAILSEIENLVRKSGVSLVDMKPKQPKSIDFYKVYNIEIEAEGTLDNLTSFLYQLNISPQLLRAEKLRLTLKDKDSSVLKVSILITKISIF